MAYKLAFEIQYCATKINIPVKAIGIPNSNKPKPLDWPTTPGIIIKKTSNQWPINMIEPATNNDFGFRFAFLIINNRKGIKKFINKLIKNMGLK